MVTLFIERGDAAAFRLPKDETKTPQGSLPTDLVVSVRAESRFLEIHVDGYGECESHEDWGSVVCLEHYDGKLRLHYAPDIRRAEMESVDLEGARESRRLSEGTPKPATPTQVTSALVRHINNRRCVAPDPTSSEAIFVETRIKRAEKPDDITVDSILYDWDAWGYRVFLRYAGIVVFEYAAGNYAGDSQSFVHPTSDNAIPEAQLGRFAAQTAEYFGAEYGVPPEEIRRENGLADTLEEATPVSSIALDAAAETNSPRGFFPVKIVYGSEIRAGYMAVAAVHAVVRREESDRCTVWMRKDMAIVVGTVQEVMAKIAAASC